MTRTELKNIVTKKYWFYINKARELYNMGSVETPELCFKMKGVTVAGEYSYLINQHTKEIKDTKIRYNLLLAETNVEHFLGSTVPHEIAHWVADHIYPRSKPHGKEWKSVMRSFGAEPKRTNRYDTSKIIRKKQRRITYHCDCFEHEISMTRHNKIIRGTKTYRCGACKTLIVKGKLKKAA